MLSPFPFITRASAAAVMLFTALPAEAANGLGNAAAQGKNGLSEAPMPLEFGGEVARGDTVVHRFTHGDASFEFRLVPFSGGWTIWIGDPMRRERNYVAVATGPFHGVNPAVIDGWHFRNADNTGPNRPGEKNVNAPGMERSFAFVLDGAGYTAAFAARDIVLAGGAGGAAGATDAAGRRLADIPAGAGKLIIDALELGNLAPNQRAVIERMAFRVRLEFP